VHTTLVECEELFARPGIYGPPGGEYRDNARRFTLLSRAVCEYAARAQTPPDVLHVHDWHTALVPLFARYAVFFRRRPATVLTLHNVGYQGRFGAEEADWLSLGGAALREVLRPEGIEDHGGINLLKAGVAYADRITTVSPTYGREILTPEGGFGLDALLLRRSADLVGILNGADYDTWSPSSDPHLPRPFGPASLEGKAAARRALHESFHLAPSERPLLGVVGRLVHQKGIDVLAGAIPRLVEAGADLVVLGSGERSIVEVLERACADHSGRVALRVGYDERLSHLLVAGCDLVLVPSRYEPCGLVQMHAMRYGTIPVVHRTGGLADTVRDEGESPGAGTGFVFSGLTVENVARSVGRALALRRDAPDAWRALQLRAMAQDFSWGLAARRYVDLYRGIGR
ncbi:MAG TPA: glycogen synthase, partial [Candidatus Polarisedimenticolia bacterium]|nr:glycogen synthase [Candidatus Polarisedimenticolia bacterium]